MALPFPSFYDPADHDRVYLERAGLVAEEARSFAREHGISPARDDDERVCFFGIDCQLTFVHKDGGLSVPGAPADMRRATELLYRHLDRATGLVFSLDTHTTHQIFHPAWWRDADGNPPPPLTVISVADVERGAWIPRGDRDAALEYTRKLEQGGRYQLTVWPYHALLGGTGHALVPALMEATVFHATARDAPTHFLTKGRPQGTEWFSVLGPEVEEVQGSRLGRFNEDLFRELMSYDRVLVFGEAKSHCVLSTLRDLDARIQAEDKGLADKIWILDDAMSPVPAPPLDPLPPALDFPRVADDALSALASRGMHRTTTVEVLG